MSAPLLYGFAASKGRETAEGSHHGGTEDTEREQKSLTRMHRMNRMKVQSVPDPVEHVHPCYVNSVPSACPPCLGGEKARVQSASESVAARAARAVRNWYSSSVGMSDWLWRLLRTSLTRRSMPGQRPCQKSRKNCWRG